MWKWVFLCGLPILEYLYISLKMSFFLSRNSLNETVSVLTSCISMFKITNGVEIYHSWWITSQLIVTKYDMQRVYYITLLIAFSLSFHLFNILTLKRFLTLANHRKRPIIWWHRYFIVNCKKLEMTQIYTRF
jgi:apolipoprotein N-acyltransferase